MCIPYRLVELVKAGVLLLAAQQGVIELDATDKAFHRGGPGWPRIERGMMAHKTKEQPDERKAALMQDTGHARAEH